MRGKTLAPRWRFTSRLDLRPGIVVGGSLSWEADFRAVETALFGLVWTIGWEYR